MMRKIDFEKVLEDLPGLTAQGFMLESHPQYSQKRREFRRSARYLQQTLDCIDYLGKFRKSQILSPWQRKFCRPTIIQPLIEWHSGRNVSLGAVVMAAVYLGFNLHRDENEQEPVINLVAMQLEAELRDLHLRQLVRASVGSSA